MPVPLEIITNNVPHDILDWIPEKEQKEFDYIDWAAVLAGHASVSFVKYKGEYYDLNDVEGTLEQDRQWNYKADTLFSGVIFKYTDDNEHVICGRYYVKG